MKKLKHTFKADKEIWLLRLYFIVCILIAVLLCHYYGNVLCAEQGMCGHLMNVALFTAALMFIGGFLHGTVNRLRK